MASTLSTTINTSDFLDLQEDVFPVKCTQPSYQRIKQHYAERQS